jgi:hypothetical protein
MNIDLKCLKETIVEEKVKLISSATVLQLLEHIDNLEEELKWRRAFQDEFNRQELIRQEYRSDGKF